MEQVFLADYAGWSDGQLREHLASDWEADRATIDKFDILLAYESVGSWGCDSSAFLILRGKGGGKLYEVHGGHCSCYGFEGQFEPEDTTASVMAARGYISTGGYDDNSTENEATIRAFIDKLAKEEAP